MRCDLCGKESPDAELDFRSVTDTSGPRVRSVATKLYPFWICPECASYRRGTYRLVYWLAAVAAILCLIALVVNAFMP
jgi:hypothetical protein